MTAAHCRASGLALVLLFAAPVWAGTELHIGNGVEPETLDPHKAQTVAALNIARDLFEGLTRLAPDGSAAPAAAERWEVSPDGLTYTFHLRPNLLWSNGDPLLAEHFAAGLRRTLEPATGAPYGPVLALIANGDDVLNGRRPASELGVEAPDPLQLRIQLGAPAPWLPGLLALPAAAPLRPSSGGPADGRPVSNGAYVLDQHVLQSHVRLRRNPRYWNDTQTSIDLVYYHPTEDRDTELKRFRAGELDITYSLPQARMDWIRESMPEQLRVSPYLGTYYLGFNCATGPFADRPALRRALSLAIDREVLASKVLRGLGRPAHHWIPDGVAGYGSPPVAESAWTREQRWAEARRLYAQAGYSAQNPLAFELRYGTSPDNRRMATVLAAFWQQALGAQVRLVNEESRALLGRLKRHEAQAFLWSWIGDYNDVSTFAQVLHSGSAVNYSLWRDAGYDQSLARAALALDPGERLAAYQAAEARLLSELPLAPLYFFVSRHLVKPRVAGWTDHLLDIHYAQDLRIRE